MTGAVCLCTGSGPIAPSRLSHGCSARGLDVRPTGYRIHDAQEVTRRFDAMSAALSPALVDIRAHGRPCAGAFAESPRPFSLRNRIAPAMSFRRKEGDYL